jgi:hypothetical protein
MSHYVATEQEIQESNERLLRVLAELRERHRLEQLRGKTGNPYAPEDWKRLRNFDPGPASPEEIEWARQNGLTTWPCE